MRLQVYKNVNVPVGVVTLVPHVGIIFREIMKAFIRNSTKNMRFLTSYVTIRLREQTYKFEGFYGKKNLI